MKKILQDASIGHNLQRLRAKQGLTQEDVCAKMALLGRPMVRTTYSQIETGARNIFVSDLVALRIVLKAEYSDIFKDIVPIIKNSD